jgi:carbamoyl-phosphate synthase large subunit
MPKRNDIKTILVIGSGPIVIGQGCEFDYSGTQACKTLRSEGYRIVLVNSNPATIMTDPEFSDRTYIEPITPEAVRKIIAHQKRIGDPIQALLPTLGGQTALNTACALYDNGTLEEFGIELIGANREAIRRAEDRQAFKEVCERVHLDVPLCFTVTSIEEGRAALKQTGLPAIIRPAFTLGGSGGGIAYNAEEFDEILGRGLRLSMIGQVQIDKSLIGWKEYELEVIRDKKDNCIVVCGIENIDPMGVHTGDSITVAPILTLTDKEYQAMRDGAFAIMREVGVETGGSNVQFAVDPNPVDGKFHMVVVEMNPRVSRSSALASKATGFPIAKIAAKLAVGYTLDELKNDITGTTSACFEPSIDYIVTKMPRWTFEKFPEADETLTTQMKSVGEAMSIGRTFCESLQKAIRSMEVKRFGLGLDKNDHWLSAVRAVGSREALADMWADATGDVTLPGEAEADPETVLRTADGQPLEWPIPDAKLSRKLAVPSQGRLYFIRYAMKQGWSVERIRGLTNIDHFFLDQIKRLVEFEDVLVEFETLEQVPHEVMFEAKRLGYSDAQLANLYLGSITPETILQVRAYRKSLGIEPVYKLVDTCAAEFEAKTPYYYSTYEKGARVVGSAEAADTGGTPAPQRADTGGAPAPQRADDEIRVTPTQKVIILGGGPNRIGQGIEFDYCCCHAAFAADELGLESVMINSNPETVSTDYDTSDLLFFEPLTLEDVLNVVERLNGKQGVEVSRYQGAQGAEALGHSTPGHLDTSTPGLVRGLIVQYGGQTPLNLAKGLQLAGAPIIGTSVDSIDLAEDRKRFDALLEKLKLHKPPSGTARSLEEAVAIAERISYPVLVRPSYVLGGRGMEICPDEKALRHYMTNAVDISELDNAPVLIDKFLDDATEVDVDVVADFDPSVSPEAQPKGRKAIVCGVMEHIEQAGIHSGDSACTIPPWSLPAELVGRIQALGRSLARELRVNGLMNVQLAIKGDEIYVLEVNPRASRTAPFVGKATHEQWPRIAAKVMMGQTLEELGVTEPKMAGETALPSAGKAAKSPWPPAYAIKESVFPFSKFPGVDVVLGPEMRSTGEVMGIDPSLHIAFAKSQFAAGTVLPTKGNAYLSVRNRDRDKITPIARDLAAAGFGLFASPGTAETLRAAGLTVTSLEKIESGVRPNVIDLMGDGKVQLLINTPTRTGWQTDEGKIRSATVRLGVPMITTITGAAAAARAIRALQQGDWGVKAMQDYAPAH